MDKWESLAERKIREAMKEGVFDVLEGAGKPLNLDEDPFEDPTMRMAHRLLRQSGFSLPWIEERKDLQAAIEKVRTGLALSWKRQQTDLALRAASRPDEAAWQRVLSEFRERVIELNRRITTFNLKSPSPASTSGCSMPKGKSGSAAANVKRPQSCDSVHAETGWRAPCRSTRSFIPRM